VTPATDDRHQQQRAVRRAHPVIPKDADTRTEVEARYDDRRQSCSEHSRHDGDQPQPWQCFGARGGPLDSFQADSLEAEPHEQRKHADDVRKQHQ